MPGSVEDGLVGGGVALPADRHQEDRHRAERAVPQAIVALRHSTLGPMTIFLVPIGRQGDTTTYQAVFN